MSIRKSDYLNSQKPVSKREPPPNAAAELVMNPETGAILHAKNADVQRDPASLTKLMTSYMVMKAVKEGRLDLDKQITISAGAAALDNNTLKVPVTNADGTTELSSSLPAGSKLTVREALIVMMTSSANGVAKALGEAAAPDKVNAKGKTVRGSERDFAREMTSVAQNELGMKNSSFINASGLNTGSAEQKSNLSTVRDMAILSQRLMKDFPEYEKFISAPAATTRIVMPDGSKVIRNSPTTNHFVRDQSPGSDRAKKDGFHAVGPQKTGYNAASSVYTDEHGKKATSGGIGLLTTAENKDGVRLVSVVMGARNGDSRYAANQKNLRTSFARLDEKPEFGVAFNKDNDKKMVAVVSPSSAFAEASRRRGSKSERTMVAKAEEERPRRSFHKATHRKQVLAALDASAAVDLSALRSPAPDLTVSDAPSLLRGPEPEISRPSLENGGIQRASFRAPRNE